MIDIGPGVRGLNATSFSSVRIFVSETFVFFLDFFTCDTQFSGDDAGNDNKFHDLVGEAIKL